MVNLVTTHALLLILSSLHQRPRDVLSNMRAFLFGQDLQSGARQSAQRAVLPRVREF